MLPSPPLHHHIIVGYHGCDQNVAQKILLTGELLNKSCNRYDWLGEGIYFWETGYQRAWDFAKEQQVRGKIKTPCVIGAYLHLGRCFDLTDIWATTRLEHYYHLLVAEFTAAGQTVPENLPARPGDHDLLLRKLDCAVMNFYMRDMDRQFAGAEGFYYQTVRGVFVEGAPAYPGAKIHTKTHIQIAVRDHACILGYFMPVRATDPAGGSR